MIIDCSNLNPFCKKVTASPIPFTAMRLMLQYAYNVLVYVIIFLKIRVVIAFKGEYLYLLTQMSVTWLYVHEKISPRVHSNAPMFPFSKMYMC